MNTHDRLIRLNARLAAVEFGSLGMQRQGRIAYANFGRYRSRVGVANPNAGIVIPTLPEGAFPKFEAARNKLSFKKKSAMLRANAKAPDTEDFKPHWERSAGKQSVMTKVDDQHGDHWRRTVQGIR